METTRRELEKNTEFLAAVAAVGWRTFGVPSSAYRPPPIGHSGARRPGRQRRAAPARIYARLLGRTGEPVLGTSLHLKDRAGRRRDVRHRRRRLDPRLQQRGQRHRRRRLGDPLQLARRAHHGLPNPHPHESGTRGGETAVEHAAVLGGVPERPRVGVQPAPPGQPGHAPARALERDPGGFPGPTPRPASST